MFYSGTDPESYITEYSFKCKDYRRVLSKKYGAETYESWTLSRIFSAAVSSLLLNESGTAEGY